MIHVITVWILSFYSIHGSVGDNNQFYRICLSNCQNEACQKNTSPRWHIYAPGHRRYPFEDAFQFECDEECRYMCMWNTVEQYHQAHIKPPQFHGKWPFRRLFGAQEFLSALFSIANFLSQLQILLRFLRAVPKESPTFLLWIIYHLKLDYFSALAYVLFSFYALIFRIFYRKRIIVMLTSSIFIIFYCNHVYYLTFIRFDYQYNMMVNVTSGILNFGGWILWSALLTDRDQKHYTMYALRTSILLGLVALLEVMDFEPIFDLLDAHAMWHASTLPLNYIWYEFHKADSIYLARSQRKLMSVD